ncbi:DNA polymerase III subunit delta' [Sulfuriferula sp. AH1]|uniref:DNA polymerase III subunit delta' n=1 Tax=Sulfuriferula sp. AH1 TaxID=1985873 RepID=UPI000B3B42DD|nr:DNA polymerase III subunit delta' [Sulfuriferula sp. AH1]ARU31621.1 DNA polymerase III subunit delta' [Sulfuriferula sp. AH1]
MHIYPWQADSAQRLLSLRAQLPHAILLHGRAGLGKYQLAQVFAKWLLCEQRGAGAAAAACGTCPSCHWFELGSHPDVHILQPGAMDDADDAGSERKKSEWISVEQVRHAIDFLQLSSHRNGLRIVLLNPAEAMNAAAANALLKTLEEPPANSLLLLVSHQPSRLLPTILSRCHQLRINLPDTAQALDWLSAQGVSDAQLCLGLAAGSPLLATTFADEEYQVRRRAFVTDLLDAAQTPVLAMAERYAKLPVADYSQLLQWLQQWMHDMQSMKLAGKVYYHQDFSEQLRNLAMRVKLSPLLKLQQRLQQARAVVAHPLNVQMVLEDILLEYTSAF